MPAPRHGVRDLRLRWLRIWRTPFFARCSCQGSSSARSSLQVPGIVNASASTRSSDPQPLAERFFSRVAQRSWRAMLARRFSLGWPPILGDVMVDFMAQGRGSHYFCVGQCQREPIPDPHEASASVWMALAPLLQVYHGQDRRQGPSKRLRNEWISSPRKELAILLMALQLACKATSRACNKAGIAMLFGLAGEVNSTGLRERFGAPKRTAR